MEWSHSTRIPRDIRGCEEVLSHDSCHEMTPDIRYLESVSNDMRNNQANQNIYSTLLSPTKTANCQGKTSKGLTGKGSCVAAN